ncbi:hypothetical protein GE09DRAFT_1216547 [Coniochaeta sp. 2T2.1]|nr:hypothetical protein GE09DRAFT_1216547 [Coniochaeta sp. 2T2.1]
MSSAGAPETAPAPERPRIGFFDLPTEVQKEIFSHCSQADLICSSLVSKAFRELAAAQLYRNFHIVFPDEDDPSYDCPIDGLAGGLDTFVTSDYDYAQHVRDLMLDTLSAGDKAETAYKPYLYSASCGKFLNTLLLLTLRKAKSLEAFRWNIRVELSRPVYKALHQIDTLKTLHLRLQAGPSLYEAPPPLPFPGTSSAASSAVYLPDPVPPPPPPPVFTPQQTFSISNGTQVFYVAGTSAPPPPPVPAPKHVARNKPYRKINAFNEPPTLSGFKNLKTLSILDMDSLDIIPELRSCVRNSATTLTKLQLSFSDYLGSQARKPPPELDPDDSDPDDEFQVAPVPPVSGSNDDASGPARAFRAQEERQSQEAVLGRIFDNEPYLVKQSAIRSGKEKGKEKETEGKQGSSPAENFIQSVKEVSLRLVNKVNQSDDLTQADQELLALIEEAARKYVESQDTPGSRTEPEKAGEGSSTAPAPSSKSENEVQDAEKASTGGLFDAPTQKAKETQKEASPDDIDIEEPLEQLTLDYQEDSTMTETANSPAPTSADDSSAGTATAGPRESGVTGLRKVAIMLEAQMTNFKTLAETSKDFEEQANHLDKEIEEIRASGGPAAFERLVDADKQMQSLSQNIRDNLREMSIFQAEIADAEKKIAHVEATHGRNTLAQAAESPEAAQQRRMAEYLRSTRGLALEMLSIYLIPVKASVLLKAIDIRALRRITLLNVGPQAPIWTQLHKENKESPLVLRTIFTDNVSLAFLNFVAELEELHDLFLLERGPKYKPESFAPKTTAAITQIRRLVLKKHMHTLRRLMIKNQMDQSWDLDEKSFALLCGRGQKLEELACSTNIKAMHTFMRRMAKLVSLRALHIISLRNEDTCVWVMRETKEFLLDNLSHHPEMKLQWVSIDEDDRVDRILMPSELAANSKNKKKKKKAKKSKGKQKATNVSINGGTSSFPVFPPLDTWAAGSDSDDDDDGDAVGVVERMPGIKFYDVWDVVIFKKEIVYGRL